MKKMTMEAAASAAGMSERTARTWLVSKGLMLSGVPNMAWCVGYTNASWTLRADLSSLYVCRLLNRMDRLGYDQAVPQADEDGEERRPLLDLSAGYVVRAADELPKQGAKGPWYLRQNYVLDLLTMTYGAVEDEAMTFSRRSEVQGAGVPAAEQRS